MANNKKTKSFFAKKIETVMSWYIPDENGKVNRPAQILFNACMFLPILIIEGIKVGMYHAYAPHTLNGFGILAKGISTPLITVIKMKNQAAFGAGMHGFAPQYLIVMLAAYFCAVITLYNDAERRRKLSPVKDGDMKFASIKLYNKELAYPINEDGFVEPEEDEVTADEPGNMIISKNARFSLAGTPDLYSCTFVQGPIGSGKSFKYVKPNILQMNASYVVTDPSCELIQSMGTCMMEHGYDVKLFNLKKGEHQFSCRYNPFAYIHDEQDVILTVDAFLDSSKQEGEGGGDPFFPIAEKNFYYALFYYVFTTMPKEKQTLKAVYELYLEADESDKPMSRSKKGMSEEERQQQAKKCENNFDKKFKELAKKDPYNPSLTFYKTFKKGSAKTKQSILISVGVKMWFLPVPQTANLLSGDDLNLEMIGDRKTVLFVAIPTDNASFKCLSAMMFTQLFQTLYYFGDTVNCNSYQLIKNNCVAYRSNQFIPDTVSEEEAYEHMKKMQDIYRHAVILDENELRKTDEQLDKKLKSINDMGVAPWPMVHIAVKVCDCPDLKDKNGNDYPKTLDGNYIILESFRHISAAKMVLDAAVNGAIRKGDIGHANRIRFILDEFFAIGKIADFDNKIATFRKYKISSDIIVQGKTQIAEMYDDKDGKIINNCDIKICLGAGGLEDAQFFSDMCGQTTVQSESINLERKTGVIATSGGGSISDNAQQLVRPEWLLGKMKGDTCLVFTRTQGAFKDKKYVALEHPRWNETWNNKADPNNESKRKFIYRKVFCIEQKDENRIRVSVDDEFDNEYLSQQNEAASIEDKMLNNLLPHYAMTHPNPAINRTKPYVSKTTENYIAHKENMKGQTANEFKQTVVKEYGSLMNNDGTLPDSALPTDAREKFKKALRSDNSGYKINTNTNTVTTTEVFLGDILNQVTNLH